MDGADRKAFIGRMMEWLVLSYELYCQFPHKHSSIDQIAKKKFIRYINNISFLVDICGAQQVIDGKRVLHMGQLFIDIRGYVMRIDSAATKEK